MLNIVILTDSLQYPYHTPLFQLASSLLRKENHTVSHLDINSEQYNHQCVAKLNSLNPDVIITFDLAGLRFSTQSGESTINMMFTKNLNIIWGNKPEYAPLLSRKISLSMLFYDALGINNHLPTHFPNMLYYKTMGQIPLLSAPHSISNENLFENSEIAKNFLAIWKDFLKEVLLS